MRTTVLLGIVATAQASNSDVVEALPGLDIPVSQCWKSYTGYLDVEAGTKALFHWYHEAVDDAASKPLVLWLNGGPGCSSLGGMWTELGPYVLDADGAIIPGRDGRTFLAERAHGIEAQARHLLWPFLLQLDAWDTNSVQRERSRAQRLERFEQRVQRSGTVQKSDATVIDGDVPRTDRDLLRWKDEAALAPIRTLLMAHCAYEAASVRGYSQGMNDVAAVVLDAWLPEASAPPPPKWHRAA